MALARTVVIDLGSNSFRLVAYSYERGRWWRRTDEIYDIGRLGAGLLASGRLAVERMDTAVEAMEVYAHFCAASGIAREDVRAVATSAIRDASNGGELLDRVRAATALEVRVLSTGEEAYFAYLAAVNSTTLRDGAVLDLGGGSLQLVRVRDRGFAASDSWALGTVRMTERFFEGRSSGAKQRDALRAHVHAELARAPWIGELLPRLVGIGGTVRNLAAALEAAAGMPSIGVQGVVIERRPLGSDPRRRGRYRGGDGGGRDRTHGGHPRRASRRGLLLQLSERGGAAAVRGCPRRKRLQPRAPLPGRPRAFRACRRARAATA